MQEQRNQCFNKKNLVCEYSGNPAFMFCSSATCKLSSSLVCFNMSCDCQTKNHKFCTFVKVKEIFDRISSQRKKRQGWMNQLIQKTTKIYDDLIEKISIEKQLMLLKLENFGVSEQGVHIIQKLNEEGGKNIPGSLIHSYFYSVNPQSKKQKKYIPIDEKKFLKFQKFQQQKIKQLILKLNKSLTSLCQEKPQINSKVIQQCYEQDTLHSFFENQSDKKINSFKKLYRASQENFSTAIFHNKCDFIPNLLILVKTTADKILGAFTPVQWDSVGVWKNTQARETFMFSISNKEKYLNKDSNYVIGTNATMGPLFGHYSGRYDMYIQDRADINNTSDFAIGSSYGNENLKQSTQKQWTEFSGAQNGCKITIKQWEVYQVIFE